MMEPGWPMMPPPQCTGCGCNARWNQEPLDALPAMILPSHTHRYYTWRCPNCDIPVPYQTVPF